MAERVCEHCEGAGALDVVGLCVACRRTEGIRVLYERRRGWSPEWDEHLRRLARRAKAGLPLFDEEVHHAAVTDGEAGAEA
jgi:hypothetical protein